MEDDPRLAAYARLLVERCIDPRPGWQVLVQTTSVARPLAEQLSRLLAERGAYALTRITFGAPWPVDLDWIEAAPRELAATLPALGMTGLAVYLGCCLCLWRLAGRPAGTEPRP